MRLLFVLILGGVLGWIVGSLYPAPQAWLAWINVGAVEQRLRSVGEQQAPATSPATSMPAPSATAAPSPSAAPTPAPSAPSAQPTAHLSTRGAANEQTLAQYRAWIHEARQAHPYADSEDRMYALMMCESRGQPTLVSATGSYSGLFQYSPATWRGAWNIYRDQGILDPRAQIFATALAWQRHMQGQWGGCYANAH